MKTGRTHTPFMGQSPFRPRPLIWLTAASAVATVTAASISPLDGGNETIANPERGIYRHQTGDCSTDMFNETTLRNYRMHDQTSPETAHRACQPVVPQRLGVSV